MLPVSGSFRITTRLSFRNPHRISPRLGGGVRVFCLLLVSSFSGRATNAGLSRPVVVLAGSILILLGTFMISLASQYWQIFLAQGLCIGLGQGLMWLPSVTVISTYFARNRVFAVTAAATGTSTGGMIFPAMIQYPTPQIGELTHPKMWISY